MNRNYVFTIASIDPAHAHIRIPSYSQNMQNAAVDFDPGTISVRDLFVICETQATSSASRRSGNAMATVTGSSTFSSQ